MIDVTKESSEQHSHPQIDFGEIRYLELVSEVMQTQEFPSKSVSTYHEYHCSSCGASVYMSEDEAKFIADESVVTCQLVNLPCDNKPEEKI